MRHFRKILRIATLSALVLGGFTSVSSSASAATPVTCHNSGGAPASSGSAGTITAFYSHRCNYVPANLNMTEGLELLYRGNVGNCFGKRFTPRGYAQPAVDFSGGYPVGSCHGYYTPHMTLTITGDLIYGSVPGCGRVDSQAIFCEWYGAEKFY